MSKRAEKISPCKICGERLQYVGMHPTDANMLVFSCMVCDLMFKLEKPDGWIEPGEGHLRTEARRAGKSILFDDTIEKQRIEEVAQAIIDFDPLKMDSEKLRVLTMQLTIITFLKNLRSVRPMARQRAAEALAQYTMKKPAVDSNVNLNTPIPKTMEELVAVTQAKLDELQELRDKADSTEEGSAH